MVIRRYIFLNKTEITKKLRRTERMKNGAFIEQNKTAEFYTDTLEL